jgi:hypothetical protein
MIDTTLEGIRCRASRDIRGQERVVKARSEGTIEYEMLRPKHHLVKVSWDEGFSSLVPVNEIEITDGTLVWQ